MSLHLPHCLFDFPDGLDALIQFGSGEAVQTASAAYIRQFVTMYSNTIGSWAGGIIGLIAFQCIFGTGICGIKSETDPERKAKW